LAAQTGSAAVLKPLVDAGADANGRTANGTTALMFAAASGNVDAVDLLVNRGADVNAMEPVRGLTPAMFAAASNRAAVMEALAARGADLKATTKMVDLNSMGRGSPLFASLLTGNPPPPAQGQEGQGGRGGQGGQGSQGPQGREGRNPFAGRAGIDRQYQL